MPHPGHDQLVATWARAVRSTSYVPMNWSELVAYLRTMTDRIAEILTAEPFRPEAGYALGAELVSSHFTGARALAATLAVLGRRALPELASTLDVRLDDAERRDRLASVLGELAAGYTEALVERTRTEQEQIRQAATSAQAEAERALRASDARLRAVFATAATGIAITDLTGRVVEVNDALAAMLGYSVREMRRRTVADLRHPSDRSEIREWYAELRAGERDQFRTEKRFFRKDGSELWADVSVSLVREDDEEPRYIVAMMHDITERQRLHQRLRHQALHDPLTQLPNRMLFFDRLYEAFDAACPGDRIGVCYLDLDGFKAVNDSLGHYIGDELLVRLANRLHERLAPVGHLVARMGGDEFVILVADCADAADVVAVAESVLDVVREPVEIGGHRLRITASIGVVAHDVADTDPASLMKSADVTLYRAKVAGKDRLAVFDAERNEREVTRHTLAATMPEALAGDEFVVEYQPIVDLTSGRALGAEALLRWHHPRYGRLGPDRFIPLAEETGMIDELGRWVLREACRQGAAWARNHPRAAPMVSVNVSAQQFSDHRLADDLAAALAEHGLSPDHLQLELIESPKASLTDPDVVANLRALADRGVRLVLDDFGTGQSTLECLRLLPVHGLKIAGSFVQGLRTPEPDSFDVDMVHTLVRMAGRRRLQVTAQRIETAGQLEQLREMGCPSGQGHYFARPGPPEEVDKLISALPPA